MSEDVWSDQDTNPDAIEAALRELLRERHAANEALAPARVLNLIVIVDRSWKGEIANRLERVGRYHASRTILCAVEDGRETLDAVAVMTFDEPKNGGIGVMHEQVEIDMGPGHLSGIETIVDPVVVSELPTVVWSPHGHDEAVNALRDMIDVMLLDSDDMPDPAASLLKHRPSSTWPTSSTSPGCAPRHGASGWRRASIRHPAARGCGHSTASPCATRRTPRRAHCSWPAGCPRGCTGTSGRSRPRMARGRAAGRTRQDHRATSTSAWSASSRTCRDWPG